MQKEIRRSFRWDSVIPTALTACACVILFFSGIMPRTALAASAGALLLLAGLVRAVGFFVAESANILKMLSGIVSVSVGAWALITCTHLSRSVFALGLGVYLILIAAAEAADGVRARKSPPAAVLLFVLAAGYAATGALLFANNFSAVFPSAAAALITAGAVILFSCAEELFHCLRTGFFRKETLVFRKGGGADAAKK